MDELRGAARRAGGEVRLLDQRDAVAARRGVERHARAGDPAAHDDEVEAVPLHRGESVCSRDHGRYVTKSPGASRPGGSFSCLRGPRWRRPIARSPSGHPGRRAASGRAQHGRRAPVAGEPARVRGEQHDVGRDRRGGVVLLVLDRVAGLDDRDDDERRRAVELRRGLLARRLLQARERLRAEHAEAPRVGQVVVRRPARELEQLVERLARNRLGSVDLVRPARADRLLDVHPGEASE